MKPQEIEVWVLRIIDRIKAKQPVEDSLVELKSEWIPAEKAARRIAAHANSARGSNILWLIGVDEVSGVIGVEAKELSNWYSAIKAQFDGPAPSLDSVNIQMGENTIVAILFDTREAPYVVKNPNFGKEKGSAIQFEIPWREGTSTRSASRLELLDILLPTPRRPKIEVSGGIFKAKLFEKKDWDETPDKLEWDLRLFLYIEPSSLERVVIPFHRCNGTFKFSNSEKKYKFRWINLEPPNVTWVQLGSKENFKSKTITIRNSKTLESTYNELLIYGPGECYLNGRAFTPPLRAAHPEKVFIDLTLYTTNDNIGIPIQLVLPQENPIEKNNLFFFYWITEKLLPEENEV